MHEEITSKSLAGPSELVLLMPIRKGFANSLDTRTYKSRVKTVAKVFSDLRTTSRESTLTQPFSDIVDRIRSIYSVHIAVVEPDQVLLAVSFDKPWEPYIRRVWKTLGRLLDTILCNCEGYTGVHSTDQGYEAFAQWIRKYQVNADTFYLHGNRTVEDVLYLDQIERLHRAGASDVNAASYTLKGPEALAAEVRARMLADRRGFGEFVKLGVKAMTAFHALTYLYPKDSVDHAYLLRAAREVLEEFPPSSVWAGPQAPEPLRMIRQLFQTEIDWFEQSQDVPDPGRARRPAGKGSPLIQGGILETYPGVNLGCMLLLRVTDPAKARRSLKRLRESITTRGKIPSESEIYLNVAFSMHGLRRLGVAEGEIREFPKEFRDGMAARAGLIGDLRANHPDHWLLPVRNWPLSADEESIPARVSMDLVDVVVQLRMQSRSDIIDHDVLSASHPLVPHIQQFEDAAKGIKILSVQLMHRNADKTEHFGFVDGISQPAVAEPGKDSGNGTVSFGEIFLGHSNDSGDPPRRSKLRDNGTFLVVRKLAQHVEVLNEFAAEAAAATPWSVSKVLAKMMGRTREGVPLAAPDSDIDANDFNYENDKQGVGCPFQAHIRRANPREGGVPRIIRRGMLCGNADSSSDRGLIFQAYNASIAEQFEVIQRWISGGNSTLGYSGQSDPLLGVPVTGEDRVVAMVDGADDQAQVIRLNLGDRQFVTLRWGIYLFVPSIAGFDEIIRSAKSPVDDELERGNALIAGLRQLEQVSRAGAADGWKRLLEEQDALDEGENLAVWRAIRDSHNGVLRTPHGVLVGNAALISFVLTSPELFSVDDYQVRLTQCIGDNYLGLDPPEHDAQANIPNAVISSIGRQEAFNVAFAKSSALLGLLAGLPGSLDIPLINYVDAALAAIAKHWFGIPDGQTLLPGDGVNEHPFVLAGGQPSPGTQTAHCPYHFTSPSRFVFQPRPSADVERAAMQEGSLLQQQIEAYAKAHTGDARVGLARELTERLTGTPMEDEFASVLLGALLGFMPTVQGNFVTTMREWVRSRELWRVQDDYFELRRKHEPFKAAGGSVAPALYRAMATRPVPSVVHRRAVRHTQLGGQPLAQGDRLVLGLVSATAEGGFSDPTPIFGGPYLGADKATHACPGREMAYGSLLGLICAFFEQRGTLKPTASNLLLTLQRD